jgi:uridine kinase
MNVPPASQGFVVGISGCSGSGKTTIAEALTIAMSPRCCVISLDAFYRRDLPADLDNFETPDLFDFPRAAQEIVAQRASHRLVVVEGIVVLVNDAVVNLLDAVVELQVGDNVEMVKERRLKRDHQDTSRWNSVAYFDECVWPAHQTYLKHYARPARERCSTVIPWLEVQVEREMRPKDLAQIVVHFVRGAINSP